MGKLLEIQKIQKHVGGGTKNNYCHCNCICICYRVSVCSQVIALVMSIDILEEIGSRTFKERKTKTNIREDANIKWQNGWDSDNKKALWTKLD